MEDEKGERTRATTTTAPTDVDGNSNPFPLPTTLIQVPQNPCALRREHEEGHHANCVTV